MAKAKRNGDLTVSLDNMHRLEGDVTAPMRPPLRFMSTLPIMNNGRRDMGGLVVYVGVSAFAPMPNEGGHGPDDVRAVVAELAQRINRPD